MLYMVRMTGIDEHGYLRNLVKVGRTKKLDRRMKEYATHNPLAIYSGRKVGYVKGEAQAHDKLIKLGCKYFINDPSDTESTFTEWMDLPEDLTAEDLAKQLHFTK